MDKITSVANPREAAFLAVWKSPQQGVYAGELLQHWRVAQRPLAADANLAYQIAYGSIQMALALDELARQLTTKGTLSLKLKERCLLRCALYQAHYMERVPLYSIVDEMVRLAKKYCHPTFASFLNASLRAYDIKKPVLPADATAASWSVRHSFPLEFVQALVESYGEACTEHILLASNRPATTMARVRGKSPLEMITIPSPEKIAESPQFYIQNATPAHLMHLLSTISPASRRILDLCAAPGGKTLLAAELYPNAEITANEVSEARLGKLRSNLDKYGIKAAVTCYPGQEFPLDKTYDLILIDAPCSNSGVLNKRPEARWRLNAQALAQLEQLQLQLLRRAADLLAPDGRIWYLTCSILPSENTLLIDRACQELPLEVSSARVTVLPNAEGWDGGFACCLRRNNRTSLGVANS